MANTRDSATAAVVQSLGSHPAAVGSASVMARASRNVSSSQMQSSAANNMHRHIVSAAAAAQPGIAVSRTKCDNSKEETQLSEGLSGSVRASHAESYSTRSSDGSAAQSDLPTEPCALVGNPADTPVQKCTPEDTISQQESLEDACEDTWGLLFDSASHDKSLPSFSTACSNSSEAASCRPSSPAPEQSKQAMHSDNLSDEPAGQTSTHHSRQLTSRAGVAGSCTAVQPSWCDKQDWGSISDARLVSEQSEYSEHKPDQTSQQLRADLVQSQQQLLQWQRSHKQRISHAFSQCVKREQPVPVLVQRQQCERPTGLQTTLVQIGPESEPVSQTPESLQSPLQAHQHAVRVTAPGQAGQTVHVQKPEAQLHVCAQSQDRQCHAQPHGQLLAATVQDGQLQRRCAHAQPHGQTQPWPRAQSQSRLQAHRADSRQDAGVVQRQVVCGQENRGAASGKCPTP